MSTSSHEERAQLLHAQAVQPEPQPSPRRGVDPQENGPASPREFVTSNGEVVETIEEVVGSGDTKKVTYILQRSLSRGDSMGASFNAKHGDDDAVELGHCHSSKDNKSQTDKTARKKLILASILCLLFMIGEMVGGLLAGSLAIISDAAHLLTDFASFMISLLAIYLASRPATTRFSFGWHRAEILGAFTSILMLWVLTGILAYEAGVRLQSGDYKINATIMLITAAVGVAFNIVLGTTLHQHSHSHGGGGGGHSPGGQNKPHKSSHEPHGGGDSKNYGALHDGATSPAHQKGVRPHPIQQTGNDLHNQATKTGDPALPAPGDKGHGHSHGGGGGNINVKAAFIHVIGDLMQSIGVLIAAVIIYFKPEWKMADPICTFLFSLFVLVTTITIMRDIILVLMEGTPRDINFTDVREALMSVDHVVDIHNLRLWSLTMDKIAMAVHLAVDKECNPHTVLKIASDTIRARFNVADMTFQIEEYVTEMQDCNHCQGP